ncbi:MAG: hypothetical protein LUH22_17870 [Bacteroides sp.]|nr:hypothetical protein [Bacteroides sp.]
MKKKYKQPEENNGENILNEPLAEYITEKGMKFSPPLTEEELQNAITSDELLEYVLKKIDGLPGK